MIQTSRHPPPPPSLCSQRPSLDHEQLCIEVWGSFRGKSSVVLSLLLPLMATVFSLGVHEHGRKKAWGSNWTDWFWSLALPHLDWEITRSIH